MLLFLTLSTLLLLKPSASEKALDFFVKNKNIIKFKYSWFGNTSKNWIEYNYIFKETNPSNFNLKNPTHLNVGVFLQDKTSFDCALEEGPKNQTFFKGYSIDIIEWIAHHNNLTVSYIPIDDMTNITRMLLDKNIDVVVCHLNLYQDSSLMELYYSLKSKYVLIYKPTKLHTTKDIFIITFSGSLWLVFFITLMLLGICLRLTTTKYAQINSQYEEWSWVEITLWAIAAACQQGLSHTPCGFASCTIFFIGYLTAYLLYTAFAANITSLLLQHDAYYKLDPTNIHSNKFNLICLSHHGFQTPSLQRRFKKTIYVESIQFLFDYLEEDNTIGFAPEIFINQYITNNNYKDNYLKIELNKYAFFKSFYVEPNSTWKEILNKQLLRMEENGILFKLLKNNLKPLLKPDGTLGYSSAGKDHVGSAIYIWIIGVLTSIIFLLLECLWIVYKKYHNRSKY